MGVDRTAVLQAAQSFAARGQYDAAITEWKKLLSNSRADGAVYNTIGDLSLKKRSHHSRQDAILAYLQAGDAFRTKGEPLKALASYKKILKIDPNRIDAHRHLGDLNAERGLVSSAIAEYSILAKLYLKEGNGQEALAIYRRILRHDPSDAQIRKQFEALCFTEKVEPEQFLAKTDQPPPAQVMDDEPDDSGPARKVKVPETSGGEDPLGDAGIWIDAGEFEKAESTLGQLLNKDPGNPAVCQLLARLHLKRGDLDRALSEYEFLAGTALRADDLDLAESLLREYLKVQPNCAPLLERLGALYEKKSDVHNAAQYYEQAFHALIERPDPDLPSLPAELHEKISELLPGSELVSKLAAILHAPQTPNEPAAAQPSEPVQPAAPEKDSPPLRTAETQAMPIAPSPRPEPVGETDEEPIITPEGPPPPKKVDSIDEFLTHIVSTDVGSEGAPDASELETHYVLGHAYKDMGLLNEAIEEFRLSIVSPDLFLHSCLQIAACLKERGMPRRAIACLEHAMKDPRCQGEQSVDIEYELGLLFEVEGLFDRALRIFETIPTFKDVPKHLDWIRGRAPSEGTQREAPVPGGDAGNPTPDSPPPERKKRRISYL